MPSRFRTGFLTTLSMLVGALTAGEPVKYSTRCQEIDYGPAFSASFVLAVDPPYDRPTGVYAGADCCAKGIVAILAPGMADGAMLDIDSLRIAAAWTGGVPKLRGWWLNGHLGPTSCLGVPPFILTRGAPGWAGPDGSFTDPRADLIAPLPRPGPLPREWARFKSYALHGRQVVFNYEVGGCDVRERLALAKAAGAVALVRTLNLAAHVRPLAAVLGDAEGSGACTGAIAHAPAGAKVERVGTLIVLRLPAAEQPTRVSVLVGASASAAAIAGLANQAAAPEDLAALPHPRLWADELTTAVTPGAATTDRAYVVDAAAVPAVNPWKSWMRPSAFDFYPDGRRAALATMNGDVWLVAGFGDAPERLRWRRLVAGLHAPLGVKIVDDQVYVACRDGLWRLRDTDGDGEAEQVECFNTDIMQTPSFHSFVCDLNTDAKGDFYTSVGGAISMGGTAFQMLTPHLGTLLRISRDGSRLDTVATGLRMPNGGSVSSAGEITVSDNQGVWVPATPIHVVKPGDFLGVINTAHGATTHPPRPLVFLPQDQDSSAGSQQWLPDDRWGPWKGSMIHVSYGKAGAFVVLRDGADPAQGAAFRLPATPSSALLRARFNPRDGQLWVCGHSQGQTSGIKEASFDRIRRTTAPLRLPVAWRTTPGGVAITFSDALDATQATSAGNWTVMGWNYKWTSNYGSPELPVEGVGTTTKGRSTFNIASATLSADGLTVTLALPQLRPLHSLRVGWKIADRSGTALAGDLHATIHAPVK